LLCCVMLCCVVLVLTGYREMNCSLKLCFFLFAVVLAAPIELSLDDCVEYIQEDELVEVTPLSIRMCKNPKVLKKR
jgi:hypothetical protein